MTQDNKNISEYTAVKPNSHKKSNRILLKIFLIIVITFTCLMVYKNLQIKEEIVINRKYNTTLWTAERNGRWVTPDTDVFNYDHTDLEAGESNKDRSQEYDKLDEKYRNENNI